MGNYGSIVTYLADVRIKEENVVSIQDDTSSKENVKEIGKVDLHEDPYQEDHVYVASNTGKNVFASILSNDATKIVEGTYV